jgi:hypothetical protein
MHALSNISHTANALLSVISLHVTRQACHLLSQRHTAFSPSCNHWAELRDSDRRKSLALLKSIITSLLIGILPHRQSTVSTVATYLFNYFFFFFLGPGVWNRLDTYTHGCSTLARLIFIAPY